MIYYTPTYSHIKEFSNPETPEIIGYQKQFSIEIPGGNESKKDNTTQIATTQATPVQEVVVQEEQPKELSQDDERVLMTDGTNAEKQRVTNKYLRQNLGLTKEQAAALVGIWQAESGFNLNAENKAEKSGKSKSVKSSQYGIGIGQWTHKRHDDFVNYVKSHGGQNNLKTQLDFAISEIINKYPDFLNNLRSATNVKDATAYTYTQYVAANHKNIKDLDDLYNRVRSIENKYQNTHRKLYGKTGSGNFDKRVKYAEQSLLAKLGLKLPIFI